MFRQNDLFTLMEQKPDEALSMLDGYMSKDGLLPEIKQTILLTKANLLIQQNRVNEVEQPLKEPWPFFRIVPTARFAAVF